jgi:DNA-binding XRE family transcriptional regulator
MHLQKNLKYLRKKAGKTQDELSTEWGIGRTTLAHYEIGKSEPNVETLMLMASYFCISVDQLLTKDLQVAEPPTSPTQPTANKPSNLPLSSTSIPYNGIPKIITVDTAGNDNIVYVPVKARAGYLLGFGDTEFMETLPTFRLPGLSNATYRMFEVDGPSMAPNILHGDRLIGEWIDDLTKIRDNRVYIIVHKGGVAVKRVVNRLKERGKFYLKSDTIAHRHEFPTVEIDPEDINEVWYGRLKISSDFSEPAEVYHRLADLETDVMEMKRMFKGE